MIEYGFFNAVDGDRTYNADSFNEFFNGILTDTGVYKKSGGALSVVPSTGLAVKVQTGRGRINQHWFVVGSDEIVTLDPADVALGRYDAIVFRLDSDARTITLTTIKGTPSASPTKPSIKRTENLYDICVAYVYVAAGATSIAQSAIEDTRDDTDLCSFVKLQIDSINAGVKEYRNIVTTTSEVTEISIGIPEFDAENDLLFSNVNGIMFVQGSDYTVSGTGSSAKMVLTNSVRANNTVEFRVIKAVLEVL